MLGKNLMRGVGQVTLLVLVATGLWHVGALLAGCFGDNPVTEPGAEWIAFHTTRALTPFVAMFAFWASLRPERACRAVCGAALVVALALATPIVWLVTAPPDNDVLWNGLLAWALNNLWVLVGVGMFAASYRRPTTGARPAAAPDESGVSGVCEAPAYSASGLAWIGIVLIPLTAAVWLCAVAAPLSPDVGVLLIAAVLYALLYRTHPVPGSPAWTALTVLVLALPNQAYIVATTTGDDGLVPPPLMLAIALGATLGSAIAVGVHLYRARRRPVAAGSAVAGDPA